jgi:UDP-glucose 6-dehydrogenase
MAPKTWLTWLMRIARLAPKPPILTIVTPVSVGTAAALEKTFEGCGLHGTIVSQPMFFTDGCAVEDFNWPDRLILGSTSNEAVQVLKQIFHPLVMRGVPVIVTNQATAELVRESATAFVATKISFINEVAALCERVGADAVNLALALGLDKKIAPRCLQPGAGMGGVFAESDMDSLAELAQGQWSAFESTGRCAGREPYAGGSPGRQDCSGLEFGGEQGCRNSWSGVQAEYEFSGGIVRGALG